MVVTGLVATFVGLWVLNLIYERFVIPLKIQQKDGLEEGFRINVDIVLPESKLRKLQLESAIMPNEELAELLLEGFRNHQTLHQEGGAPCQTGSN